MRRALLLCLGIVWGLGSLHSVDVSESVVVLRFGRPLEVIDGQSRAGLHTKWPWPIDSVRRVDRRQHLLDLPAVETLTRDANHRRVDDTIVVQAFTVWRVGEGEAVEHFLRTLGTPEQAERILTPRLVAQVAATVSGGTIDELIGVAEEPTLSARRERFQERLNGKLSGDLLHEYGIELVEFRLRRVSYPEAIRSGIADRIRAERARKAAEYESEGRRKAAEISATAERDAAILEADARAAKRRAEGKAEAEADRLRAEAIALDPDFYFFLKKLKTYQAIVNETRDTVLLSTKHPLFDLLLAPPGQEKK